MNDAERVAQAKSIGESNVLGVKQTQYVGPVERAIIRQALWLHEIRQAFGCEHSTWICFNGDES
jgi:hypothetical protein